VNTDGWMKEPGKMQRFILSVLRTLYSLLYHQLAWTYDFVAAAVSLGHWKAWVQSTLPYVRGERVLELGFGPGHLQRSMQAPGRQVFGLDESPQMCRQARRRLRRAGLAPCLGRGYAQALPYAGGVFSTVVATFPSEYIFDPRTLAEIRRVLRPGGRLVVAGMAWITGNGLFERLTAWIFRITGETQALEQFLPASLKRFEAAGFVVRSETVVLRGSQVLVIAAEKSGTATSGKPPSSQ
jgi:ubiquinone/menaquinone biosynthesis C-methylase UbiE